MTRWIPMAMLLCGPLLAQDIRGLVDWAKLGANAKEKVDVNLEGDLLQFASKFLSKKNVDEAKAQKIVEGLKGVYVRSFQFEKPGQYTNADLDPIRAKLVGPAWSKIVEVSGKSENTGIYLMRDGGQVSGLVVISAEPKEFTVVNIVGPIQLEDLAALGGKMGIPNMQTGFKSKKE
jgi:hypothetical protein